MHIMLSLYGGCNEKSEKKSSMTKKIATCGVRTWQVWYENVVTLTESIPLHYTGKLKTAVLVWGFMVGLLAVVEMYLIFCLWTCGVC